MGKRLYYGLIDGERTLKGNYGYLSDMSTVAIKSLMPTETKLEVNINYERYLKEMELWLQYRSDYNKSLFKIKNINSNIYWNEKDDSIIARILPIVLSNDEFRINEIIKNVLFTTGNLESLFEGIALGRVLYGLVEGESSPLEMTKELIIHYSQIDFLEEFNKCYRISLKEYPGSYKVDFEKTRIELLNLLNGIVGNSFNQLNSLIKVLDGQKGTGIMENILRTYIDPNKEINISQTFINFGNYLENLKDGNIEPENLYIEKYETPDIFEFEIGDRFYHSLLNNCEVVSKIEENNNIKSIIKTKSGIYEFKK